MDRERETDRERELTSNHTPRFVISIEEGEPYILYMQKYDML